MKLLLALLFTSFSFAQQIQKVDFKSVLGKIFINPLEKTVSGTVTYDFAVNQSVDTLKIDAQKMNFSHVKINGREVRFVNSGKSLNLFEGFIKGENQLVFDYVASPKQAMYFVGDFNLTTDNQPVYRGQVWTQGQGKYTSHWFPSFDDTNEKVIFNLDITFNKNYLVLANGILTKEIPQEDYTEWQYRMDKPMSSYLLALTIGDFRNKVIYSKSGVPIQLFIQPKDTLKFDATYRYSKKIFDFLEKKIGVKYPWEIYKQVPVEDFLYGGMENTTLTLFSQEYVVDETGYNDGNYVYVNAHELAHHWFGDLITAKTNKHHWLQEGFATYYGLLAERKIFGKDYFYNKLFQNALQLRNAAKKDTIPVMNEKASTLSFYQKGAWALHIINEEIGEKAFGKAVKTYLKKYSFKNVETDEFLAEIKKVAPKFDVENFKKVWLEDYHFQYNQCYAILEKNQSLKTLFDLQLLRKNTFEQNKATYEKVLKSEVYYPAKVEVLYQLKDVPFDEKNALLKTAMLDKDIEVRKALVNYLPEVPLNFKSEYESFLNSDSYDIKQSALINLYQSFQFNRVDYLEKAKNWMGANDKSLRITYLYLSQITIDYDDNKKAVNLTELINYTSPGFESSVRQNAFQAFELLSVYPTDVLKNLVNATTHHQWQVVKNAKNTIRKLLKQSNYREEFQKLISQLNINEQLQLQKLLDEK